MKYQQILEIFNTAKNKAKGKPFLKQNYHLFEHDEGLVIKYNKENNIALCRPDDTIEILPDLDKITWARAFLETFLGVYIRSNKGANKRSETHVSISTNYESFMYMPGTTLNSESQFIKVPPYKLNVPTREKNNEFTQIKKKLKKRLTALYNLMPEKLDYSNEIKEAGEKVYYIPKKRFKTKINPENLILNYFNNQDTNTITLDVLIRLAAYSKVHIPYWYQSESKNYPWLKYEKVDNLLTDKLEVAKWAISIKEIMHTIEKLRDNWIYEQGGMETHVIKQL